jgi:toxin ParE1/3/4
MALEHFPERGTKRDDILKGLRTIGFERRVTIGFRVFNTKWRSSRLPMAGEFFESGLLRKG